MLTAGMKVRFRFSGVIGIVQRRRVARLMLNNPDDPKEEGVLVDTGEPITRDWNGHYAVEVAYGDGRRGWIFAEEHEVEVIQSVA